MPPMARSFATEALPDGRQVVDGEWVVGHDPLDGCWCGEADVMPCRHQAAVMRKRRVQGVLSMPLLARETPLTARIASEIATHPGIGPREWLRLIAHGADSAQRVAGFRTAVRYPEIVAALRGVDSSEITVRLLRWAPLVVWPILRTDLDRQMGRAVARLASGRVAIARARHECIRVGTSVPLEFLADLGLRRGACGGVYGRVLAAPPPPRWAAGRPIARSA